MMRVFIVCCVLLGVLQVQANPLSTNQKLILKGYHENCLDESKADDATIDNIRKGAVSDDPAFKNYIYCFSTRLGFLNDNGIIQKDTIEKHLSKLVEDKALLSKILEQCLVQKSSPQETTFYIAKCMREVNPNLNIYKQIVLADREQDERLVLLSKKCAERDSLDELVIDQALRKGIILEDTKFKNFIHCFLGEEGFHQKNGSINKVLFEKVLGHHIDDLAVAKKLVEQCAQNQETPEDTSFFMLKCAHENSPAYAELIPREVAVPEEQAKLINEHARACIEETKVDGKILEQARQGIFQDDPRLKEFSFCISKKAGIINDVGEIQKDTIKEKTLKLFNNMDVVKELVDKCATQTSEGPVETAFRAVTCLHKNSPGHLSVFGVVSAEKIEKKREIIKHCAVESGVSRGAVLSARRGVFQDDPIIKQYILCINTKTGMLTKAGEYNHEVLEPRLTQFYNAEETGRIIEKCGKKHDDPLKTSFEGFKCLYNEVPEILNLL